jgi:alpha-glucosidase
MPAHSYKEINVADQENDPNSVLNHFRSILKFRKQHKDVFIHGAFAYENEEDPNVFTFTKTSKEGKVAVVVLNFTSKPQTYKLSKNAEKLSVAFETPEAGKAGELAPYAAKIYM